MKTPLISHLETREEKFRKERKTKSEIERYMGERYASILAS